MDLPAEALSPLKSADAESSFRVVLKTEYDGTDFVGFQRQPNGRTVQESLEDALSQLFKKRIVVHGCSRTDSGVHASEHISHADVPFLIPLDKFPLAMNALLPPDVCVKEAALVSNDFHARFASRGKLYIYRIWNDPVRPVIERRHVTHVPGHLDREKMRTAARILEGRHDFSAFCAQPDSGKKVNPIRTMDEIRIIESPDSPLIEISVRGRSFLYNMVRILAGTIVYVGQGKIGIDQVEAILAGRDRRVSGKTMPPQGLTLEKVFYDRDPFSPV